MNILQSTERTGYPSEYLLARLSGRRAYFIKDWDHLLHSHDPYESLRGTKYPTSMTLHSKGDVWKSLSKEHSWIYLQMNSGLRDVFQPYFVYAELKTLLTYLRYNTQNGSTAETERLLTFSLLSDKVKDMMKSIKHLPIFLESFEKSFLLSARLSSPLVRVLLKEGLTGVEQTLKIITFTWIMNLDLHPVMERFFTVTADLKNIMIACKHLRWRITSKPVFFEGGKIRKSVFLKIIESGDVSEIVQFIHRYTGERPQEPALSHIECVLLKSMTKQIRTMAREHPDSGPILDYLWRCYLEALNISIILYGQEIESTLIKNELIAS